MNSHLPHSLWQNRWAGAAVACGLAALAGLLVAWTMPRGPATATQALIIMALGLAVGLIAGLVLRSRWALLSSDAAFFRDARLSGATALADPIGFEPWKDDYSSIFSILE